MRPFARVCLCCSLRFSAFLRSITARLHSVPGGSDEAKLQKVMVKAEEMPAGPGRDQVLKLGAVYLAKLGFAYTTATTTEGSEAAIDPEALHPAALPAPSLLVPALALVQLPPPAEEAEEEHEETKEEDAEIGFKQERQERHTSEGEGGHEREEKEEMTEEEKVQYSEMEDLPSIYSLYGVVGHIAAVGALYMMQMDLALIPYRFLGVSSDCSMRNIRGESSVGTIMGSRALRV